MLDIDDGLDSCGKEERDELGLAKEEEGVRSVSCRQSVEGLDCGPWKKQLGSVSMEVSVIWLGKSEREEGEESYFVVEEEGEGEAGFWFWNIEKRSGKRRSRRRFLLLLLLALEVE